MAKVDSPHHPNHPGSNARHITHRGRLVGILGALTAFGAMAIDLYLPAFPRIAEDLRTDTGHVELTVSFFLLGLGLGQLVLGPLSDRLGRRAPLITGALLYALAALGGAWANSIDALIGWRLLMALGGAAGSVIARAVVRDLFEPRESAHIFSVLMLIMGVVPILAPVVGGQLVGLLGWRGLFGIMAAFGTACAIAVVVALPESLPASRRARGGLGEIFRGYAALLRERRFVGVTLASGLVAGMMFAYITGISTVLMGAHGLSERMFGLCFGINAAGLIFGSQYNRLLLRTRDPADILRAALRIIVVATAALLVNALTDLGGLPLLCVLLFVILSTTGVVYPNATTLALAPYPQSAGSASALLGTGQYALGFVAGVLVSLLHDGGPLPMAGVMFGCALSAWVLAGRISKDGPTD